MSTTALYIFARDRAGTRIPKAPRAPMRLRKLRIGPAMLLLDIAGLLLLWLPAVLWLMRRPETDPGWPAVVLYPALDLAGLYALGLYRRDVVVAVGRAAARVPLVAVAAVAAATALIVSIDPVPPAALLNVTMTALGAFITAGLAARTVFDSLRRRGLFVRRLLVVGAGLKAWELVFVLRREGVNLSYEIGFAQEPVLGGVEPRLADGADGPILQVGPGGFLELARRFEADQIVVAPDERRGLPLEGLLAAKIAGYPVQQYLDFMEREVRRVDLKRMELGWLVYSDGFQFGLIDRIGKRVLDILASAAVLLLASPLLLAGMLMVKLEDGGPIFYRQTRVTQGGKPFTIFKLRTMRVDSEKAGAVWAQASDPRVTRIGMMLRRSRIDELPQLFTILGGAMSFVGPRPERPEFVEQLAAQIPLYRERHIVKAGLTGWAQVNYPYGASIDDARSKLSYDLYYVKNFNILFDLAIIAQTVRVVLWPSGVR